MRRYLIFATAGLGLLMYSIDTTAVSVAFPSFMREFRANVLWAGWTISIYYIAVTVAMPLMGRVSDSFGRKRVFLLSLALFTGSSLACGLAPDIYSLIFFRFLQGVGGAAFLPTASGIVSDNFPENRERAIGLFSSIFPIGGIIGPNIGGWIVGSFSWRYIFYINLPIGAILMLLVLLLLKGSRPAFRQHLDLPGAAYLSGAIVCLMFGLNLVSESLSAKAFPFAAVFLSTAVLMVFLFYRREQAAADPFLDLTLLRSRPFLAANLLNMIIGAGVFGILAFVPLYATSVYGLSTLLSGMILTPRSFGAIPASATTSFFLKRWGYRGPIVVGLGLVGVSTLLLGEGVYLAGVVSSRFGVAETLSFLILLSGIGMGILFPAVNNACIELMPQKVATIVGLRGMFRTVGGALGISLVTLVLHLSTDAASGFRVTFIIFGCALLVSIPLALLVPPGRKTVRDSGQEDTETNRPRPIISQIHV
jgi:EmrB/QacA subfamily drug resistance transporter